MKSRFPFNRESPATRNSVRTVIATLCVLGLVSLTLFHFDDGTGFASRTAKATSPETRGPVASSDYLRAPTSDPSLPSLEATFPRNAVAPAYEAPTPTF